MRALTHIAFAVVLWLLAAEPPALAQAVPAADEASEVATPPSLDLDRLLKPRAAPSMRTRYGGKDREAWSRDFSNARSEVAELEDKVEAAQQKYRQVSDAEWGYSPIGGGTPTDPEVLRVRAEIKRDRQSLEAARQRLRELGVEASLAGVPKEWSEAE
jgi:hypothetical protein